MKKRIFILMLFVVLLFGCGSSADRGDSPGNQDSSNNSSEEFNTKTGRLITYKASVDLETDNFDASIQAIRDKLADGWFDNERIDGEYAYLVARVPAEDLDDFIQSLKTHSKVSNYEKTATDISLSYQETKLRIASLEAELERLIELKAKASIYDLITINTRISDVERQILTLQNKVNQDEQFVEYSVVTIQVFNKEKPKDETSFGSRVGDAFFFGLNALIGIGKILLIVVVALAPFAVIGGPIAFFSIRHAKKKKKNNLNQK